MTTPDPSRIREGFARAFPGRDFDRAVERLDKLVGRFVRMGSFADATIAMARNVDYGGGRTTISDSDFALVAFFAGAGRLWLVSDPPEPSGMERLALAEETLTEGTGRPELVYSHELGAHVYREPREKHAPTCEPDAYNGCADDCPTLEAERAAEELPKVELSIELGREDITEHVRLDALEVTVATVRLFLMTHDAPPLSAELAGEAIRIFPPRWLSSIAALGLGRFDRSSVNLAVNLGGGFRLKVNDHVAYAITGGTHGSVGAIA